MKRVERRAFIALLLAILLAGGMIYFCGRTVTQGRNWIAFFAGADYYEKGSVFDRNGMILHDGQSGAYAESKKIRLATMHLVGGSNVGSSVRKSMASHLNGYNPITGTAFGSHDVSLTIDANLSVAAYEALGGKKGTVAVYNYQSGDLLCAVSTPTFDPADPPSDLETNSKYEGAYLNRFFSATYTPGSIFKIVTTAAALERLGDVSAREFYCDGKTKVGSDFVTCPYAHGTMNLNQALARSCNGVYAELAVELGGEVLLDYAKQAGLLDGQTISGVSTAVGKFEVAEAGSTNLGWAGVGQYNTLVNPCAMLTLMGGIANDGVAVTPRLLRKETFSGTPIPAGNGDRSEQRKFWSSSTCSVLRNMMRNNVQETYGQDNFGDLAVCAKSGTAEVGGSAEPHAWFVGFIDDPAHPLAFVIMVENGSSGAKTAGAIAAKVLKAAAYG